MEGNVAGAEGAGVGGGRAATEDRGVGEEGRVRRRCVRRKQLWWRERGWCYAW